MGGGADDAELAVARCSGTLLCVVDWVGELHRSDMNGVGRSRESYLT